MVQLLVAVKNSKTEADIKQWFVDYRKRKGKKITDDDLVDIIELLPLLERVGVYSSWMALHTTRSRTRIGSYWRAPTRCMERAASVALHEAEVGGKNAA